MSIEKSMKNALLMMNGLVSFTNNAPTQYNSKQRQYFSPETKTFAQQYAKYASDFVAAEVQGLNPTNPTEWQTRNIRFSDVVKPSAAIQRHFDDYKMILFADRDIEYVRPGTKIITMGSTWIVVNPMNVSGADGTGLVRRCNAVWNYLDYYGNVVSEPIIVENERASANDSDIQSSELISKGYFNVICQYNDFTRQIDTNTRLILGTGAYHVTGYSDFETEFTGDYDSVRLLAFTIRYEEPNKAMDDMQNHIAGGKNFSIEITLTGEKIIDVGKSAQLIPHLTRNGIPQENPYVRKNKLHTSSDWFVEGTILFAPESTYEQDGKLVIPYSEMYLWSSSNESVATVDQYGIVTGVSEGTAIITATLEQNPKYHAEYEITVSNAEDGVRFADTVPETLAPFTSVNLEAAYYENGAETSESVTFSFSGADTNAYKTSVNGNTAKIESFGYSETPLTVTAEYGGYAASVNIRLEGF